jgi:8-oxo-dGTP pyrophosphatase MutT (NUDIX family)
MYKVFFNDRKLFLTDDFTRHFQVNYGLFYKYRNIEDLQELLSLYSKLTKIDCLYLFHNDIEELREDFRKCFLRIEAGGGLIRNTKGEFLLIYRRGRWDLPKGKLSGSESHESAALREAEEECGIKGLEIIRPLISTYHIYWLKTEMVLKRTTWFEMVYKGKEEPVPEKEEDITDIRWVAVKDLEYYLKQCFPLIRDVFISFGI